MKTLIEKMIYQIDYIQGIETAIKSLTGPWNDKLIQNLNGGM